MWRQPILAHALVVPDPPTEPPHTLNLLCQSHPQLSAQCHLHGHFNFKETPLTPLGTKVILHKIPPARSTWEPHGVDRWYIGHAPEHYQCYTIYVTKMASTRITVGFFPTHTKVPTTSMLHSINQLATNLIATLKCQQPTNSHFRLPENHLGALTQLADIFPTIVPTSEHCNTNVAPIPTVHKPPSNQQLTPLRVPLQPASSPRTQTVVENQQEPTEILQPMQPCTKQPINLFTENRANSAIKNDQQPEANETCSNTFHGIPWKDMENVVMDPKTGKPQEYRELIKKEATQKIWQ